MSSESGDLPRLVNGQVSPLAQFGAPVNGEVRVPITTGNITIPAGARVSLRERGGKQGIRWVDPRDGVTYVLEECAFVKINGVPWAEAREELLRGGSL